MNLTAGETLLRGDVFSIANVNFVNPMSRRIVGPASAAGTMQFVVTADLTAAGGGADVVNFEPAIVGPGGVLPSSPYSQYQNVDALPVVNATVTLFPEPRLRKARLAAKLSHSIVTQLRWWA